MLFNDDRLSFARSLGVALVLAPVILFAVSEVTDRLQVGLEKRNFQALVENSAESTSRLLGEAHLTDAAIIDYGVEQLYSDLDSFSMIESIEVVVERNLNIDQDVTVDRVTFHASRRVKLTGITRVLRDRDEEIISVEATAYAP